MEIYIYVQVYIKNPDDIVLDDVLLRLDGTEYATEEGMKIF